MKRVKCHYHFLKLSLFSANNFTCCNCTNFLMSVLPLSWLISAWKNFPEFRTTVNIWKHGTKDFNPDFGCFDKVPIPKGPYSCDTHCQQLTDRDKNKNIETTVTSRSKCIYMTKASFHNQVARTSLYSSQQMLSLAEGVPGPSIIKHENAKRIYVKPITDPVLPGLFYKHLYD